MHLSRIVAWSFLAVTAGAVAYVLVALGAVVRWERRRRRAAWAPPGVGRGRPLPPVSVLKPVTGKDPFLEEALGSFFRQRYPAPYELVFGTMSPEDPALDVVRRLAARFPDVPVRLSTRALRVGPNPKVQNLAGMLPMARYEHVVVSDADVRVGEDYLARVVAPLAEPGVGAVTCLYRSRPVDGGLWSELLALTVDALFVPAVLVGLLGRKSAYGLGATLALRRETLERIGGFGAVAGYLADDYHLARLVAALGLKVVLAPAEVETFVREASLGSYLRHEARWLKAVASARPWGYAFSFLTYPAPLALLTAVAFGAVRPLALAFLGTTLAARLAVLVLRRPGEKLGAKAPFALLVAETLAFGLWAATFLRRPVEWQGRRYAVGRGGRLAEPRPSRRRANVGPFARRGSGR